MLYNVDSTYIYIEISRCQAPVSGQLDPKVGQVMEAPQVTFELSQINHHPPKSATILFFSPPGGGTRSGGGAFPPQSNSIFSNSNPQPFSLHQKFNSPRADVLNVDLAAQRILEVRHNPIKVFQELFSSQPTIQWYYTLVNML